MEIAIPTTTKKIQDEIIVTDNKVTNAIVTDDLFTYASIRFTFGGKQFSGILWDENSTPTYEEVGVWDNDDVVLKVVEIINQ